MTVILVDLSRQYHKVNKDYYHLGTTILKKGRFKKELRKELAFRFKVMRIIRYTRIDYTIRRELGILPHQKGKA